MKSALKSAVIENDEQTLVAEILASGDLDAWMR
jgi:hypothetical protein